MKCTMGHAHEDCICPDDAVVKQDTRRAIVTGAVILAVILISAALVSLAN